MEEPPLPPPPRANAWSLGPPRIPGLKPVQASMAANTTVPTSPGAGGPTDVKGSPSVIAAANVAAMALSYVSPKTDPQQRVQPPVTRAAQSQGRGDVNDRPPTLEERMAALAPRGRIQRKVWLTEEEKKQLKTALQRQRRAQDKRLQEACSVLMVTLARYDLPLVQIQLAEYAADPANLGTAGSMRKLFLALYARCCHTKHVDPVHDVLDLPVLAAVLKRFKPARELLVARVAAAKQVLAESFSGAHRMGRVDAGGSEMTLSQLRIDIFAEQRRDGATAKDLAGHGDLMPQFRVSKAGVPYTLEFRHQLHIHRHFSAKGSVLSYANTRSTLLSAVHVLLENVDDDVIPQIPAETTSTLHDIRFHYLQRRIGCREILSMVYQFLCIIYDDASKRGVSFLGSALIGSRADGSRYYEILRVSRLLKDLETDTTKSGLNGARALIAGLEDYGRDQLNALLWNVFVILCDTTGSNTGTKILTGKGGSASHLRSRIEELTRGPNGEQGHILVEQRDCLSHAGHNECDGDGLLRRRPCVPLDEAGHR